jgi:glycosyltransferase involved in cell wall biosynthesis
MKLSVVTACCNEKDTIEKVLRASPVENIELFVVDDGSTDGTIGPLQPELNIS